MNSGSVTIQVRNERWKDTDVWYKNIVIYDTEYRINVGKVWTYLVKKQFLATIFWSGIISPSAGYDAVIKWRFFTVQTDLLRCLLRRIETGTYCQWPSVFLASTLGLFVGLLGGSRGGGCLLGLLQVLFLFLFHGRHLTASKCLASIKECLTVLRHGCLETRQRSKEKEVTVMSNQRERKQISPTLFYFDSQNWSLSSLLDITQPPLCLD